MPSKYHKDDQFHSSRPFMSPIHQHEQIPPPFIGWQQPLMPPPIIPYREKYVREKSKGENVSSKVKLAADDIQESDKYKLIEQQATIYDFLKIIFISVLLLALSVFLEFVRIEFDFLPNIMDLDFSIFPEFIVLIYFGAIACLSVVILKNIIHALIFYLINGNIIYVGELSSLITDIVFILFALIIFKAIVSNIENCEIIKKTQIKYFFISGLFSSIITAITMLPIENYLIYPLYVEFLKSKGYKVDFLSFYAEKFSNINSIWQGLLIFNLPWGIVKLVCVTIITTLVCCVADSKNNK